jgi:toxin ParE1/3/4
MRFKVIVEPVAESDIKTAFSWYEDQVTGLGHEFVISLKACFARLERNPEIYSYTFENVRRAGVERFPFSIFYKLQSNAVYVIAVFHYRDNPASWLKRAKLFG